MNKEISRRHFSHETHDGYFKYAPLPHTSRARARVPVYTRLPSIVHDSSLSPGGSHQRNGNQRAEKMKNFECLVATKNCTRHVNNRYSLNLWSKVYWMKGNLWGKSYAGFWQCLFLVLFSFCFLRDAWIHMQGAGCILIKVREKTENVHF